MKQVLEEGATACRPTRPMVLDRLMNNRGAISAASFLASVTQVLYWAT
jgi:hypothetical protein